MKISLSLSFLCLSFWCLSIASAKIEGSSKGDNPPQRLSRAKRTLTISISKSFFTKNKQPFFNMKSKPIPFADKPNFIQNLMAFKKGLIRSFKPLIKNLLKLGPPPPTPPPEGAENGAPYVNRPLPYVNRPLPYYYQPQNNQQQQHQGGVGGVGSLAPFITFQRNPVWSTTAAPLVTINGNSGAPFVSVNGPGTQWPRQQYQPQVNPQGSWEQSRPASQTSWNKEKVIPMREGVRATSASPRTSWALATQTPGGGIMIILPQGSSQITETTARAALAIILNQIPSHGSQQQQQQQQFSFYGQSRDSEVHPGTKITILKQGISPADKTTTTTTTTTQVQGDNSNFESQGGPELRKTSETSSSTGLPQPVTTTSKPVTTTPKPVTTASKPVTTTSKPVTTASKPVTTTSKPVTTTSESVTTASKPVTTASESVTTTSKPVTRTTSRRSDPAISTPTTNPSAVILNPKTTTSSSSVDSFEVISQETPTTTMATRRMSGPPNTETTSSMTPEATPGPNSDIESNTIRE